MFALRHSSGILQWSNESWNIRVSYGASDVAACLRMKAGISSGPVAGSCIWSWPCLSLNLYDMPGLAPRMNVLFWGPGDFPSKLLKQGYLVERLKSSFRKFLWSIRGSCWAIWSNPLTNVKWHSDPWPTVTSLPIRLSTNSHNLYTELDLHRIMSGFHGAFATGVASQQGTLTLPDT